MVLVLLQGSSLGIVLATSHWCRRLLRLLRIMLLLNMSEDARLSGKGLLTGNTFINRGEFTGRNNVSMFLGRGLVFDLL